MKICYYVAPGFKFVSESDTLTFATPTIDIGAVSVVLNIDERRRLARELEAKGVASFHDETAVVHLTNMHSLRWSIGERTWRTVILVDEPLATSLLRFLSD